MQDDLAGLVATMLERCNDWDGRTMPDCEEPRGTVTCGDIRKAATTIEAQAREIAELKLQDDGWERVGFLEEKLRQAEASIESLNGHLPKYLTALAERDAKLRVAMEALEAANKAATTMRNSSKLVGQYPNDPKRNQDWIRTRYHDGREILAITKPALARIGAIEDRTDG